MSITFTKSKYTTFRKCPKCLWLGTYKPEEQVIDTSTQARKSLLRYCELDTYAMVKVLGKLRELAK